MDAQIFLANFATIAEAPGGVQRLRDLVLDLAVSGQLVEPDPSEGDGDTLLAHIADRRSLILPQNRALSRTSQTAASSTLLVPSRWAWTAMHKLHMKMGAGSTPRGGQKVYVGSGVVFLRSQNVWNDGLRLGGVARIPAEVHSHMAGTAVQPGDVLLNITGASIGRSCVVPRDFDQDANVSQHVAILRQVDDRTSRWIHLFLISPHGFREIITEQVGISREGLSMKRLGEFAVPVPPLSEQGRILAKVDELMGLCDELQARQDRRKHAAARFRGSALQALIKAETRNELRQAWERVSTNWPALTEQPGSVSALRQTILGLAVAGHLVGGSMKADGPDGESLVNRIRRERGALIKQGLLRQPRGAAAAADRAQWPGSGPPGWTLCALDELGALENTPISDGPFGSKLKSSHYVDYPGHRVLRLGNVKPGIVDLTDESYISAEHFASLKACHLRVDDLLVASLGNPSGRACVVTADALPAINKADCFRVRLHASVLPGYVSLVLNSPRSLARAAELNRGDTRGRITLAHLKAAPIPLPALDVQRSIVERVEHFLSLCSQLETALGLRVSAQEATAAGLVRIA